jgi:UDP-glucose 4-epimerase
VWAIEHEGESDLDKILITGGTGFVGSNLAARLSHDGYPLTLARRASSVDNTGSANSVLVADIGANTDWRPALDGCDVVVHLAAQVPAHSALTTDFDAINNAGTARLVEQSIEAGVTRFVFMSSVSTMVENSVEGKVDEKYAGRGSLTPYGLSKRAAEDHVAAFACEGRVGISLRPPLVYGANAKGRWGTLQRLAASWLPLPFGAVNNRRSLVAVENLADAVATVISVSRTKDVSGTYLVAESEGVSTCEIVTWLREGMGIPRLMLPVPVSSLRGLLKSIGYDVAAQSLLGDLVIDSTLFRTVFEWSPKVESKEAIRISGAQYRRGL